MRGEDRRSGSLFSYVDLEARAPRQHPLRAIRQIVNASLAELSAEFQPQLGSLAVGSKLRALYSHTGRPGIAPERLLRALLLQAFYSIRSERRLMAELEFNLLHRWFVGLGVDDAVWDATVFCKNRDRLLAGDVGHRFLAALLAQPRVKRLLSSEHFSVDGTLIEAWASIKSFQPIGGAGGGDVDRPGGGAPSQPAVSGPEGRNAERDFHGARWSNETHRSTTDGDARLYRKGRGKEARLAYLGHALMENRSGLVVGGLVIRATGEAERLANAAFDQRRSRQGAHAASVSVRLNCGFSPVFGMFPAIPLEGRSQDPALN